MIHVGITLNDGSLIWMGSGIERLSQYVALGANITVHCSCITFELQMSVLSFRVILHPSNHGNN